MSFLFEVIDLVVIFRIDGDLVIVVCGISYCVEFGEVVVMVGELGLGKFVVVMVVVGLLFEYV